MANLRELRSRIKSVAATKKITKAQELIATSRVVKARTQMEASLPYAQEITKALQELASVSTLDHVLITPRAQVRRAGVIIYTSDRGMCGGYNHNVLLEAKSLIKRLQEHNIEPVIFMTGAKGIAYSIFNNEQLTGAWSGFSQTPHVADIRPIVRYIHDLLLAGSENMVPIPHFKGLAAQAVGDNVHESYGIDEIYLVSTRFISMMTQRPQVRKIAPLTVEISEIDIENDGITVNDAHAKPTPQYIFEPEPELLLDMLLPQYLSARLFSAALEASAAESASRRTAMKSATDNATELGKTLLREANLARQAQITSQISEIVGTTAALGGAH